MTHKELTAFQFKNIINNLYLQPYKEDNTLAIDVYSKLSEKEKQEISGWLMRQYFNSQKNQKDFWYSSEPTLESVLEFVANPRNKFPHKPGDIVKQFKLNKSLKLGLNSVAIETDYLTNLNLDKDKKYHKGEISLHDIGASLGGITATMVNKISDKAIEKFRTLMIALDDENSKTLETIDNIILSVASAFADAIYNAESMDDAFIDLIDAEYFSVKELATISPRELSLFDELWQKSRTMHLSEVEDVFINDIDKFNNEFILFQYVVSKMVIPTPKRGRPKKVK